MLYVSVPRAFRVCSSYLQESLFSFLGEHSETKACCSSKEADCVILQCNEGTPDVTELRKKLLRRNQILRYKRLFFQKIIFLKSYVKLKFDKNRKL